MGNKTTENNRNKNKTGEKNNYNIGKQDNRETNKNKTTEKNNQYIHICAWKQDNWKQKNR